MTDNISNRFRALTVKVNNGSGCLFQPLTAEYSYVLTARHVIKDLSVEDIKIEQQTGTEPVVLELIAPPYYDENVKTRDGAAIIKIKKNGIEEILPVYKTELKFDPSHIYKLCGYPLRRRNDVDSYRSNDIELKDDKLDDFIEAEIQGKPVFKEVDGMSGGGILRQFGSNIELIGIQSEMVAKDENEILGRINFIPLDSFQELIEKKGLPPLMPSYLTCFLHLKDAIFPLNNLTPDNTPLRDYLLNQVKSKLCESIFPHQVLKEYNESLLISGHSSANLFNKHLWITFLEFIVINLMKDSNDEISIESINNYLSKNRFLFGISENWMHLIKDIYKSNLKGLSKGGSIIISTDKDKMPTVVSIPKTSIPNIAKVQRDDEKLQIDSGIDIYSDFGLFHIYKFQKDLLEKQFEYPNDILKIPNFFKDKMNDTFSIG
ncbi:hypothetical protein M2459_001960 [Parabacteroides sp. PF5-5]|uniref:ABC-three component system protein n=1 Tax=unclassified Parabacteroides TaxID=2649774 RepID=UPI00247562CF|nr:MULTISPECIES: ABC-three component system protein [unclassified Parabacteroides]MDH6306726.1 hypothetical protein [Parabacteroides sp. PH5-39]MDH6316217.1 hypothetical protein [Parabacteroides sp. PF5-13]MDH6321422.1 hypothetical protein [Parabacteroides sp. PH5-13]MDH6325153.1 hypothetical protein [Parabacteroides sp. PH5-8]MDH6327408.1 hypothetical protein [Parabacteroides sp. PH5-41]